MPRNSELALNIENRRVNITGREVDFALTVNGGIPAPTLEFTEGDEAEIVVRNKLSEGETSIHWHGILLPPEEDGVPYVNTPPIFPGQSRTFKFSIRQSGTYWYHSHTGLQEQKGVYGALVIHPKKKRVKVDKEAVVVLSDWSNENADQIIKNLRKDRDYYLYKKNSVRSIWGAAADGQDIDPVQSKELLMGMAETYDVLFTVPDHKNYELRATAQDVTGYALAWIGSGTKVPALDKQKPDLYAPMNIVSLKPGMNRNQRSL